MGHPVYSIKYYIIIELQRRRSFFARRVISYNTVGITAIIIIIVIIILSRGNIFTVVGALSSSVYLHIILLYMMFANHAHNIIHTRIRVKYTGTL